MGLFDLLPEGVRRRLYRRVSRVLPFLGPALAIIIVGIAIAVGIRELTDSGGPDGAGAGVPAVPRPTPTATPPSASPAATVARPTATPARSPTPPPVTPTPPPLSAFLAQYRGLAPGLSGRLLGFPAGALALHGILVYDTQGRPVSEKDRWLRVTDEGHTFSSLDMVALQNDCVTVTYPAITGQKAAFSLWSFDPAADRWVELTDPAYGDWTYASQDTLTDATDFAVLYVDPDEVALAAWFRDHLGVNKVTGRNVPAPFVKFARFRKGDCGYEQVVRMGPTQAGGEFELGWGYRNGAGVARRVIYSSSNELVLRQDSFPTDEHRMFRATDLPRRRPPGIWGAALSLNKEDPYVYMIALRNQPETLATWYYHPVTFGNLIFWANGLPSNFAAFVVATPYDSSEALVEAEGAQAAASRVRSSLQASGGQYVGAGEPLRISLKAPDPGTYGIFLRLRVPSGKDTPALDWSLDGQARDAIKLAAPPDEWATVMLAREVELPAGPHTLTVQTRDLDLDAAMLVPVSNATGTWPRDIARRYCPECRY